MSAGVGKQTCGGGSFAAAGLADFSLFDDPRLAPLRQAQGRLVSFAALRLDFQRIDEPVVP